MKKIMFNDKYGLTTAVLEGRKTMTRRVITQIQDFDEVGVWDAPYITICRDGRKMTDVFPAYQVGEEVAVAQRYVEIEWRNNPYIHHIPDLSCRGELNNSKGWCNKMFVRANLMPHRIRITGIKVERLQDISDKDCLREGITMMTEGKIEIGNAYGWDTKIDALKRDSFFTPREAFASLIDRVSGRGTWDSNPWVWVYQFELIKPGQQR